MQTNITRGGERRSAKKTPEKNETKESIRQNARAPPRANFAQIRLLSPPQPPPQPRPPPPALTHPATHRRALQAGDPPSAVPVYGHNCAQVLRARATHTLRRAGGRAGAGAGASECRPARTRARGMCVCAFGGGGRLPARGPCRRCRRRLANLCRRLPSRAPLWGARRLGSACGPSAATAEPGGDGARPSPGGPGRAFGGLRQRGCQGASGTIYYIHAVYILYMYCIYTVYAPCDAEARNGWSQGGHGKIY